MIGCGLNLNHFGPCQEVRGQSLSPTGLFVTFLLSQNVEKTVKSFAAFAKTAKFLC